MALGDPPCLGGWPLIKINSLHNNIVIVINNKFDEYNQISEEAYERLRKIFESIPPLVFCFNPSIQLRENVYNGWRLMKGFFDKDNVSDNKWNR